MELEKHNRAHVTRLDLDSRQSAILDGQAHTARALWNLLHEYNTFRQGRLATLKDCDEAIRQARRDIDWLKDLPAQACQAVLKTYRQAWANFFNPDHPAQRPTFKARFRARMAVDVPQGRDLHLTRLNRRWGEVNIPKLGRVRFRWTKDLPGVTRSSPDGKITGARLVKESDGWHIIFRVQTMEMPPARHEGPVTAIDRGVAVALALACGEKIRHREQWLSHKEAERLLRLERKAARQKRAAKPGRPTSNRLKRTYDQIASLRGRAKRRVIDWQHQSTAKLTDRYSVIVLEDLKVKNMMASASGTVEDPGTNVAQKRGLNRSIAGEAWSRTAEFLAYKALGKGGKVVCIPAANTSRECHQCHTIIEGSRESQARFVCKNPACGWIGNADTNAARTQLYRYNSAVGQAVNGRGGPAVLGPVKRQATHGGTTPALQGVAA